MNYAGADPARSICRNRPSSRRFQKLRRIHDQNHPVAEIGDPRDQPHLLVRQLGRRPDRRTGDLEELGRTVHQEAGAQAIERDHDDALAIGAFGRRQVEPAPLIDHRDDGAAQVHHAVDEFRRLRDTGQCIGAARDLIHGVDRNRILLAVEAKDDELLLVARGLPLARHVGLPCALAFGDGAGHDVVAEEPIGRQHGHQPAAAVNRQIAWSSAVPCPRLSIVGTGSTKF